ncbi:MAG: hypothetical protein QXI32_01105 [Candidatus Bathyarchaeia archaeon]
MASRLIRSNKFVAMLLGLDGVLNGVYLNDVFMAVPFVVAAVEFYMTSPTWRLRRWLVVFTGIVIALSLAQGMDYLIGGATGQGIVVLLQGVSLFIVNMLVVVCLAAARSASMANQPT